MTKFILASASPRRKRLLQMIGLDFEVIPSQIEEVIKEEESPEVLVKDLAYQKAFNVAKAIKESNHREDRVVIGADTVVAKDKKLLGKPRDFAEAYEMLSLLNNSYHNVLTGISIIKDKQIITDFKLTKVYFKKLTPQEIKDYIATGEPFDKAGGYGIQAKGSLLVKRIEGCFYNVVGLSINKFVSMLKKLGVDFRLNG